MCAVNRAFTVVARALRNRLLRAMLTGHTGGSLGVFLFLFARSHCVIWRKGWKTQVSVLVLLVTMSRFVNPEVEEMKVSSSTRGNRGGSYTADSQLSLVITVVLTTEYVHQHAEKYRSLLALCHVALFPYTLVSK